jgi:putative peptidoglycan lipid II flippase
MISALTLVSRVLGLLRDMACGHAFGVGGVWSSFALAFQVPNLFRRLFGEGALSAASIPVLTDTLTREGREAVDLLVSRLVGMLIAVLVAVCIAAEMVVAGLFVYYRSSSDTALTLTLTAMLLPYLIFICTVAILGGVQNVFGRFGLPAFMPIILNIFMISAALGGKWFVSGGHRREIVLLAAAVMVAGLVQVVWQWFAVRSCGLRMRLRLEVQDPALRRIGLTMLPMLAGMGAVQINVLLDTLIAWWFVSEQIDPVGTVERAGPGILYYAQRLYQFPLGVFAIALATAIFPTLSRHAAEEDMSGLGRTLSRGIRVTTFEALPCLVGLVLIRKPLVAVLLNRGEFAAWDAAVDRVSLALCMYALGIWAYAVNHLVVRAFYALHDARRPLKVAVVNIFINLVLNLILVQTWLKESGLALATSICAVIQVVVLTVWFNSRIGHIEWVTVTKSVVRSILAAGLMGAAIWALDRYVLMDIAQLLRLLVMVGGGAVIYVVFARLLRCEELGELLRR